MNGGLPLIGRLAIALTLVACLAAAVAIAVLSRDRGPVVEAHPGDAVQKQETLILAEAGPFRGLAQASRFAETPEGANTRTLKIFNERRAFPGAPPVIPHEIAGDIRDEGQLCLGCHRDGGFAKQFKAFTPVVPHPEYGNCRQCHVPQPAKEAFRESTWVKLEIPYKRHQALPGSPPTIPHTLGMRENCLACHAGPAAVKEIKTSHPERVNCRQCHVPDLEPLAVQQFARKPA